MKARVYKWNYQIIVKDVEDPEIEDPRDAVLKITSTDFYVSDLHMYDKRAERK